MSYENILGNRFTNLTEVEVAGLNARYDLANGHAYHDLPAELQSVVSDLPAIWKYAKSMSVPDMEEAFKLSSAEIFRSTALSNHGFYSVSPTASNSIDIVGTWLNMKRYDIGLLEPVFDNLYLMLRRRGVNITSIQESDLIDLDLLEAKIKKSNLKSLFIVTPNNPTGFQLGYDEFKGLCNLCAQMDVALVVDKTFRLYSKQNFDDYKILNESGVDYVVIEDTGKTWPTQDSKVSLMVYSESLAKDLRMLYEEIYLCSSNFTLAILKAAIDKTRDIGVEAIIHQEVARRMHHVETALAGSPLALVKNDQACSLPLAWLDCTAVGFNDLELVQKLKEQQVALLPGRFFYWDSQDRHTNNVRLSLMKPDGVFYRGLDVLSDAVREISKSKPEIENNERPVIEQKIEKPSRDPG